MTGSQHFITSFITSILVGTLGAVAVFMWQDSFAAVNVSPFLAAPVVFALGHMFSRWVFKHWVSVTCPYGCGNKAYPLPGRHDRFRCESCGQDF